jgi:DNA helicase HerA-like ATPase
MKQLTIATNLKLPIDVAGQTIALLGIRGSGKTNTAGVIAEELLDHNHPIVVIDPTDAWWGLRSGYPVFIFGGSHGDIP